MIKHAFTASRDDTPRSTIYIGSLLRLRWDPPDRARGLDEVFGRTGLSDTERKTLAAMQMRAEMTGCLGRSVLVADLPARVDRSVLEQHLNHMTSADLEAFVEEAALSLVLPVPTSSLNESDEPAPARDRANGR